MRFTETELTDLRRVKRAMWTAPSSHAAASVTAGVVRLVVAALVAGLVAGVVIGLGVRLPW